MQVLNKRSGTFTEVDGVILAALATQAAVSIDNSMLFISVRQKNQELLDIQEKLERRVRDLKLLFDLESAMGRASSLDEILLAVLGEAMRSCEARGAAVALRDLASGDLFLHVVGEPPPSRKKHPVGLRRVALAEGRGVVGYAMKHQVVVRVTTEGRGSHPPRRGRRALRLRRRRGARRPPRRRRRAGARRHRPLRQARSRDVHRRGPRALRAHRGERLHRHPPAARPRGARQRGPPHHHRPAALRRRARSQDPAHGHRRLRPAHEGGRERRQTRRVRRQDPAAVRPHPDDAARGARVRAGPEDHPRPQGLPPEVLGGRAGAAGEGLRRARHRPRDRRAGQRHGAVRRGQDAPRSCTTSRATR